MVRQSTSGYHHLFLLHTDEAKGTISLRYLERPNPISIQAVIITEMDIEVGKLGVNTTDAFLTTPILVIKPWREGIIPPPHD